jgi:hypothetical protein
MSHVPVLANPLAMAMAMVMAMAMAMAMALALAMVGSQLRHVIWTSIYSVVSSHRNTSCFYQAKLLHTLLTPRTLVR